MKKLKALPKKPVATSKFTITPKQILRVIAAVIIFGAVCLLPVAKAMADAYLDQYCITGGDCATYDPNSCADSTSNNSGAVAFDDSQSSDTGNQTTVDDDGTDPSPTGSPDHQSSTSYANGQLGALHTNYIALNPGWASANGLALGDIASVTYQGNTIYAVYGDNHVGNTPHAEISVKADMALQNINDPKKAGNLSGVHFVVYPNTHQQLNGSVDQSKIDQIGAQVSGGPASTPVGDQCCQGSSTQLVGNTPAEQVWNYFNKKGLSNVLVAAIMGNLEVESGFDPTVENGGGHSSDPSSVSVAWGLAQWDPGSKIIGIQQQSGVGGNISDLATQLDIVWWEASTNHSPSGGWDFSTFTAKTSVDDATTYWQDHFEGASGQGDQARLNSAHKWLGYVSGSDVNAPGTPAPSNPSASCPGGSGTNTPSSGSCKDGGNYAALVGSNSSFAGVDQGIDFVPSGSHSYDICAPAGGKIVQADPTGHHFDRTTGQTLVVEKLDQAPSAGHSSQYIYYAEIIQIDSGISVGVHVNKGDKIGVNDQSPGIEVGWATGGSPNASLQPLCSIGIPTVCGQSFNSWVLSGGGS